MAKQTKTGLVYIMGTRHANKCCLEENRADNYAKIQIQFKYLFVLFSYLPSRLTFPDEWVTVEGRFRCVSLTCMSSSCPKSPLGLSPSAHLADGTGDLILVWDTNPLGFLKYLYRHTSAQDQVGVCGIGVLHIFSLIQADPVFFSYILVWLALCGGPSREGCPLLPPPQQRERRIRRDRRAQQCDMWSWKKLCWKFEQNWVADAPNREKFRTGNDSQAENSQLLPVWSVLQQTPCRVCVELRWRDSACNRGLLQVHSTFTEK